MTASNFVHFLCQNLVDNPEAAFVTEEEVDGGVVIRITVAKEDMGKVIGKEGRIIRSIRDLARLLGTKQQLHVNVVLEDQDEVAS